MLRRNSEELFKTLSISKHLGNNNLRLITWHGINEYLQIVQNDISSYWEITNRKLLSKRINDAWRENKYVYKRDEHAEETRT